MKQITKRLTDTNLSKLKAYALSHAANSIRAKDYKNKEFTIEGYAVTHVKMTEDDDSVREMDTLTLLTTDGTIIGTNSQTMLDMFYDMIAIIEDDKLDLSQTPMIIKEGKCREGSFNSLEFVL